MSKASETPTEYPLAAWFLGPRAENANQWYEFIQYILEDYVHWRRNYFPADPVVVERLRRRSSTHESWLDRLTSELDLILNELKHHFPFHSPRYNAHMLSEQTLPALLGYFAGLLYNPNNVTDEAAPITVRLELEVGQMVAAMLGYNPKRAWAHLCSGGTIANLEALWVARTVQFLPFTIREYCCKQALSFPIKTANGSWVEDIRRVNDRDLLSLRPNESIFMPRKLAKFIHDETHRPPAEILSDINDHLKTSAWNIARRGLTPILQQLSLSQGKRIPNPKIFVSASAHYSVKKAANVLGYGEESVVLVPTNSRFQLDIDTLRDYLWRMQDDQYVAVVIGVVGTTEEGAVDPIHKIRFLRDKFQSDRNRSFWIHVDAAWGGYIRSLFCGSGVPEADYGTLEELCDEYIKALQIEEQFNFSVKGRELRQQKIRWAARDLYASFLAMPDADSTAIDPHKMGYVPYPAGMIAFRNGLVTELITQRAQYISEEAGGVKAIDEVKIEAVGPYILEGSKAGATALACWLAHETIPLNVGGHGKIMRTTLLNAKKLFKYIVNHRRYFHLIHSEVAGDSPCPHPFVFLPFAEPDTNIVCFMARPMTLRKRKLELMDFPLKWINRLNEKIWTETSIPALDNKKRIAAAQPFFVSRTRFEDEQYKGKSIKEALDRNGILLEEYKSEGLFVLRSTVMNPWHFEAEQAGIDYLYEFIKYLHRIALVAVEEVYAERRDES